MNKNLQLYLLTLSFFLFYHSNSASAQTTTSDRLNNDVQTQKVELNPASLVAPANPNITEKTAPKLSISTTQFDSIKANKAVSSDKFVTSKEFNKNSIKPTRQVNDKMRGDDNSSLVDNRKKDIDAPLFPDFQVTATKEEPYDNTTASKETASTQLVKLARVPEDELQAENTAVTNVQTSITLSPLKRKYLEGVVSELEKEIKDGKKLSTEIQAKKKELDDLKKLLAQ